MKLNLKKDLYKSFFRIRSVEESIAFKYETGDTGLMRCPVHLSSGQEAVAAAFSKVARKNDYAVGTHRGHAHYLPSNYTFFYSYAYKCDSGHIYTKFIDLGIKLINNSIYLLE